MKKPSGLKGETLKYVKYLQDRLRAYEDSPYLQTYQTIDRQLRSFNEQLTIKEDGSGKIDLFAEKDDKSFDKMKWYFDKILELNKNLAELRRMMTTKEVEMINQGVTKSDGVEEFLEEGL